MNAAEVAQQVSAVGKANGSAVADRAASEAASKLQLLPSERVTEILSGFEGATERGRNWLRSVAADVSDNGTFPGDALTAFFQDRSNDPDARYVAYQLLVGKSPEASDKLLSQAETDPSLPVRYLKIKRMNKQAAGLVENDPDQAKAILRQVVANGRSPKQLEDATKMLADLGVQIDLADELGMIRRWWVIGPFDNTNSEDFDTAYTPEQRYLDSGSPLKTDASGEPLPEKGKDGAVNWQQVQSEDSLGMVDLNEPLSNAKDSVAYAFTTFTVKSPGFDPDAQIRIGCITASKVWVNGQLVSSNDVYHSGTRIDQYIDSCKLVEGENTVLIKVLQNAQTEPWAQDWEFQFRLTRPDGSAIKTTVVE